MGLYFFPSLPGDGNGYSIAVKSDYLRLNITKEDIVMWYCNSKNKEKIDSGIFVPRFGKSSYKRALNLLNGRVSCELLYRDLPIIDDSCLDKIFCGDVILYRALRKRFPQSKIIVRFHNCFRRIEERLSIIGSQKMGLIYKIDIKTIGRLEKEIFNDNNVYKIFISEEDMQYYRIMTGKYEDSEVWPIIPDLQLIKNRTANHSFNKIVYYGGIDTHKIDSVKWFINDVFPKLRESFAFLELHLFGNNTENFDNRVRNVFGHGYYSGKDFPFSNEAIYINPDLTGGGVKIKLKTYMENDIVFLSTPFGFEGYSKSMIDNKYCYVVSPEKWVAFISNLMLRTL